MNLYENNLYQVRDCDFTYMNDNGDKYRKIRDREVRDKWVENIEVKRRGSCNWDVLCPLKDKPSMRQQIMDAELLNKGNDPA